MHDDLDLSEEDVEVGLNGGRIQFLFDSELCTKLVIIVDLPGSRIPDVAGQC